MLPPGAGDIGGGLIFKAPAPDLKPDLGAIRKLGKPPQRNASETPLVRIKPEYPMRARQDGIEGSVGVRFDIDTRGKVTNVRITSSKPRGVFDRAVMRAVKRWRCRPKQVDGTGVWRRGISIMLPFRLNN